MNRFIAIFITMLSSTAWPQDQITIDSVSHSGRGCPPGSVAVDFSEDKEAFTLIFSDFIATTDSIEDQRKGCDISFIMNTPRNWGFSIYGIQFRGGAILEKDSRGYQDAAFIFDGNRTGRIGAMELEGEYFDSYERAIQVPLTDFKWFGCQERKVKLRIRTGIKVEADELSQALMTIDSIDGDSAQTFGLQWRRCDNDRKSVAYSCKIELTKADGTIVRERLLKSVGRNTKAVKAKMVAKQKVLCDKAAVKFPNLDCGINRDSCRKIQ